MNGEFLWEIIVSIIWPPKGIIYMEVQALMWLYTLIKVWLINNGYLLLIGLGIVLAISYSVFGNARPRVPRMGFHRIWHTIIRGITNITFAWFFLIYGAGWGDLNGNNGANNATYTYTRRVHAGPVWNVVHNFSRVSLHFHLGRGIFRIFYRLLGCVSRFNNNPNEERTRVIIARVLAMLVIFWGVWMIPYDLTH